MSKNCFRLWFSVFLCCFSVYSLSAQDRSNLEKERTQLLQEIETSAKELAATRKDKANTLSRFLALQKQVEQRERLIDTYQEEIQYTDNNISRTSQVVDALSTDLEQLISEYTQIMRVAMRNKMHQSYLVFLFSSKNLNEVFQRWQYIRQYDQYRKRQARLILETQNSLAVKIETLEAEKSNKISLLADLLEQNETLQEELNTKDNLLKSLKSSEVQLANELKNKEKAAQKLNAAIEDIIQKEIIARRKKESEKSSKTKKVSVAGISSFAKARGKLPWPVQSGNISKPFGTFQHPKFKSVKITNNGIDIKTERNAAVQAVFSGEVAGTQFIPGYKNTVIIQHDNYYTVYSNLSSIYVKRGDEVKAAQEIGKVGASDSEVHFEVWKEKERLNPSKWVLKP